ncbi:uncharacterized protein LOC126238953 [Schistocerca nitens]|uniref:uncharacterized protein LOC126238953 n=1 Tax=Schistocerca nitens TaxID=7011 RepID=UPI0021191E3B|nr:uncharacterized protein LOC126238953 [Schistocerca nitens]
MGSFLLPVYNNKIGLNSDTQSTSSETAGEETVNEAEETENYNSVVGSTTPASTVSSPSTSKSKEKSCRRTASNIAEQLMTRAFGQLTNVLSQRLSCANSEDDECDMYGKLLAKKMQELPQDDRKLMMYEIDGLFIKRIKQRSFSWETLSPHNSFQYSRPSSVSSGYIVVPNCSAHVQTSFSEPSTPSHDSFTTNPISNFERSSTPLPPPISLK